MNCKAAMSSVARTNITGFAKNNFSNLRRRNSTNTSVTSSGTDSSASTSKQERGRDREIVRHLGRLSSEEARTTTMGREAREDGIYTDENGAGSPFIMVSSRKNGEKSVEPQKKEEEDPQKKKKKRRELNIPQRNMFAPDFKLELDEDLPGFSPIDSEYESEDEVYIPPARTYPRYNQKPLPPPLMGLNPDIPNEYDPVIGIISIQGVKIPRSRPIDIIMLVSEIMYDVFKERIRRNGKEEMLTLMENMAMTLTCGQMCGRLVPMEMMDQHVFYYDYETTSFWSKQELINLLMLCEPDDVENSFVAASFPSTFHRETPEQLLERNKYYQHLMERPRVYLRRTNYMRISDDEEFTFSFDESTEDNEQKERMTLERQLKNNKINHEEMGNLIRRVTTDLEEAERLQGVDFIRRHTISLFDARVITPSSN
uniref:Uncharacterized protein n=2 Tax=Caenorhabditis tropicalis TaxID=1561998 RepID=A0A1I7TZM2_9PELO